MENQINDTIEQQAKEDSSAQTNRVFTDAYALQIADQVLTNIERVQLKAPQKSYEVKKIRNLLAEYKAGQADDSGETLQTEFRVLQELHFWRSTLARRDEAVKAFHLRRFYDENAASVNAQTLAALGCFYRSLMPSFEVRSKYDFVVTQLFSAKLPDKPRYVRVSSAELIERLQRFNVVWTGIEIDWADEKMRRAREEAIAVFEVLRAEVVGFSCLEDLLKSNFFNRVRRHKQYLGETFFAAEVTAASIQCNVTVGNKFSQLVAEENESFREALEAEHGGVDVLNLVLEENPSHSINLLKKINPEHPLTIEDADSENASEAFAEAQNSAENFSHSQAEIENEPQTTDCDGFPNSYAEAQNFDGQEEKSESVEFLKAEDVAGNDNRSLEILCEKFEIRRDGDADFLRVLSEISKREPTEDVLREYLSSSSSPEVRNFDLEPYLKDVDDTEQSEIDLKRRALRLIFVVEDYQRRLLLDAESVPAGEEIKSLKNEIQTLINDMRAIGGKLIGGNRKDRGNALLNAVNDLFQARLRIISASSAPLNSQREASRNQVSPVEKSQPRQPFKEIPEKPKAFEAKQSEPHQVNRGLIALTILVTLFGLAYFLFPSESLPTESQKVETAGVKDVNLQSLRGGEQLVVARISNNTLIGVVGDAWSREASENKRAILQSLLGQGTEFHYRTVLLFSSKGEIVGNATGKEIIAK